MSIYSFNCSRSLCEALGIPFVEHPDLSDQEMSKIPSDASQSRSGWLSGVGHKRLPESKQLQSEAQKGKCWCHDPITYDEKLTHVVPNNWILGRNPLKSHGGRLGNYDEARRKKISDSTKGRLSWNAGIGHSDETKEKFKLIASARPIFACPHCDRQIRGQSNLLQHIKSKH